MLKKIIKISLIILVFFSSFLVKAESVGYETLSPAQPTQNPAKISYKTNEIYVSNEGNQVVEIGYYQVVEATNNSTINSGNYICLFVKRDGKYFCLRDMSTSDVPLK